MPTLRTDHYSILKQTCKDCPLLVIEPDGVHVHCDPTTGECRLDWANHWDPGTDPECQAERRAGA